MSTKRKRNSGDPRKQAANSRHQNEPKGHAPMHEHTGNVITEQDDDAYGLHFTNQTSVGDLVDALTKLPCSFEVEWAQVRYFSHEPQCGGQNIPNKDHHIPYVTLTVAPVESLACDVCGSADGELMVAEIPASEGCQELVAVHAGACSDAWVARSTVPGIPEGLAENVTSISADRRDEDVPRWSERYPDGRCIFYDGDDPDGTITEEDSQEAPYTLVNMDERHGNHLHETKQSRIRPGVQVKLTFETADTAESMWVMVTGVDGDKYTGTLNNIPIETPVEYGDVVKFTLANIWDVH